MIGQLVQRGGAVAADQLGGPHDAVVEGLSAPFDQSVGVHQQRRARRDPDPALGAGANPAGWPARWNDRRRAAGSCRRHGPGSAADARRWSTPVHRCRAPAPRRTPSCTGRRAAGRRSGPAPPARRPGWRVPAAVPGRRCAAVPSRWPPPGRARRSRRPPARSVRRPGDDVIPVTADLQRARGGLVPHGEAARQLRRSEDRMLKRQSGFALLVELVHRCRPWPRRPASTVSRVRSSAVKGRCSSSSSHSTRIPRGCCSAMPAEPGMLSSAVSRSPLWPSALIVRLACAGNSSHPAASRYTPPRVCRDPLPPYRSGRGRSRPAPAGAPQLAHLLGGADHGVVDGVGLGQLLVEHGQRGLALHGVVLGGDVAERSHQHAAPALRVVDVGDAGADPHPVTVAVGHRNGVGAVGVLGHPGERVDDQTVGLRFGLGSGHHGCCRRYGRPSGP